MHDLSSISASIDKIDQAIINQFQDGIPVCKEPYSIMAHSIGIEETELLDRINTLLENGVLTRFGPLYDTEKMGGLFSLCAIQVPEDDFENITEIVNQFDEVAHNYKRDHLFNMWFVLAVEHEQQLAKTISEIELATKLEVYNFPKKSEFKIHLRFEA